ncbi:MAG: hydrogenase maturation nickel metallochaperone HypA [Hyphomicrobiaceae bacterium]
MTTCGRDMHELAIAQGLVSEVERVAAEHGAEAADLIVVRIGALAGVEAVLLERAFSVASAGTIAADATLQIEAAPLVVWCPACRIESEARDGKALCAQCGDWSVRVVSGEEMLLVRVGLVGTVEPRPQAPQTRSN